MGRGIEVRERSIRIVFSWQGKQRKETLENMEPTPANIKYATRLADEIKKKIAAGIFEYAVYFPNSAIAKSDPAADVTLKDMSDRWLATKGRLSAATLSQYKNALVFWQKKFGADRPLTAIPHSEIAGVVGSHPWPTAKLCNNYLIPLRGLFELLGRDRPELDNPMRGVNNTKHQKSPPDPLSAEEMESVLAHMAKQYDPRVVAYFEFMFTTGVRPEEAIAVRWQDIDWNHGTIRIQVAKTFKGTVKALKTSETRDVDLVERAMNALRTMKQYTYLKTEEVFENPVTGKSWHDERSQRDHYWAPTLKRKGIRHRRAYQTRHTYATIALMSGVNPAYIARQLGHANPKMVFTTYAKWIDAADRGREKAKMEAILNGSLSQNNPSTPANIENTGRHDWTRTNDPYHVKVVL